jgi:hypothetical protein
MMSPTGLVMVWSTIWSVYNVCLGLRNPNCFYSSFVMMFMLDLPSNMTSSTMLLSTWTCIIAMWKSITIETIIKLSLAAMIFFLPGASLATTYYFKSGMILKNCPKVKVCSLSNNCWVIFSEIKMFLVFLVDSVITHFGLCD